MTLYCKFAPHLVHTSMAKKNALMCFRAVKTTLRLDVTSSDSKMFSYHILHMIENVDAKRKKKTT